ncbi:MAG: MATE family efflux transporter, partial [Prevotella sp.]
GFADTLMIGHHTMPELAAASFVNSIFTLVFVFSLGFCNGITPIVGSHYGRGETQRITDVLKNSLVTALMLTVILSVVLLAVYLNLGNLGQPEELVPLMRPYLLLQMISLPFVIYFNTMKQFSDGMLHTRTGMWIVLAGNLLNILGNWLLIYGHWGLPELGLQGAGLSTLISRIVMTLLFVAVLTLQPTYQGLRNHWKKARVNRADFMRLNKMGWPLALQMGMETAAFNLSAIIVGWIGVTALAANQILTITSQFCYFISSGMAVATSIRVSLFYGQKDEEGVRRSVHTGFALVLLLLLMTAIVVLALRWRIGGWFTDNAEVSRLVALSIIPLLVYQFSDGMQNTYANALRGLSEVKLLVPIAFLAYFVVCLPMAYLLAIPCAWGLQGIWWAYLFGLSIAAVLYFAVYRRAMRKKFAR